MVRGAVRGCGYTCISIRVSSAPPSFLLEYGNHISVIRRLMDLFHHECKNTEE